MTPYYPLKKINFTERTYFPIFKLDPKKVPELTTLQQLVRAYTPYTAYLGAYILYFDLHNEWHQIPLLLTLVWGLKKHFALINKSKNLIRSVYLKKDLKTLVIVTEDKGDILLHSDNVDLSDFPEEKKFPNFQIEIGRPDFKFKFQNDIKRDIILKKREK